MEFEWDPHKAAKNLRKHKVSFVEAATVFDDHSSLTVPDPDHSTVEPMKKDNAVEVDDELRPEYDLADLLKGGVRGKYVARYRAGTNLVLLDPDVAKAFPDEAAVNEALRLVIQLGEIQRGKKRGIAGA